MHKNLRIVHTNLAFHVVKYNPDNAHTTATTTHVDRAHTIPRANPTAQAFAGPPSLTDWLPA